MLLSFRVANVLSVREEQVLSFVATDLNEGSARRTKVREAGKALSVVPVIGVYGANASGKSKVLDALIQMQTAAAAARTATPVPPAPPAAGPSGTWTWR